MVIFSSPLPVFFNDEKVADLPFGVFLIADSPRMIQRKGPDRIYYAPPPVHFPLHSDGRFLPFPLREEGISPLEPPRTPKYALRLWSAVSFPQPKAEQQVIPFFFPANPHKGRKEPPFRHPPQHFSLPKKKKPFFR